VSPAPYRCEQVVPIEQEPRHHLVIANDFVRAFAVEIAPHDRTLCHHHAHEYLMYVVGDAEIVSAPRDGEPKTHSYRDGDCELADAAGLVHVVENMRDTKFRNLLVEFLPGFADLRRGAALTTASEDVNIRPCFDDQRASVSSLQLENGSQVEVCGPAILASPYESEVEVVAPQGIRTIQEFKNLAWIEPGAPAMLRNRARHPASAVLIALGHR
jgi:hypothetical protein